jgi:flavin-dependent dehydrogenase
LDFEVIIIGASAAGLYTAELLAKKGVDVALFEREGVVDPQRRIYIITSGLERVMDEIPYGNVKHQVSAYAVETKNEQVTIPLAESDLILERNEIRQTLAKRACQAGADLHLGFTFEGFREIAGRMHVIFTGEKGGETVVTAGTVVGADGVHSAVAHAAGILRPTAVPLLQAEIHLPAGWPRGLTKVWFDVVNTRYFYWLIPESESRGVVGLIGEPGQDVQALLKRFLEKSSFRSLGMQSGPTAMHHPQLKPWGRVGNMDVLLVGDAAGQVKVTTVGGTVSGLWGARAAVEAITTGIDYPKALKPLKRELDLHWWIRRLLERLDNEGYDRLVANISPKVIRFLGRYDRDGMRGHFWKLPILQPRFIPLGLQILFQKPRHTPLPPFRDRR